MSGMRSALLLLAFICVAWAAKPNILFLQTDSMDGRVVDPESYIYPAQYTPNLRKLASAGINFVNTYSPSPQCVPSRSAMWTGLRVDQTKTWNNNQGLCGKWQGYKCVDQNVTGIFTLFDVPLRAAGYKTGILGRVDMGAGYGGGFHDDGSFLSTWTRSANIRKPTKPGPEMADSTPDPFAGDWKFAQDCIKYIGTLKGETQPFFLHCGLLIPHPGYTTNSTYIQHIPQSAIKTPTWLPYNEMHPYDQYMVTSKCTFKGDCQGNNAPHDEIIKARQLYYAQCAEADAILGTVIDALKASGRFDNTVIMYTSDHGEMGMDHRQWLKNSMYEGSSRVPLIVSGPGIPQNHVVKNVTSLLDIYPTLMDLAGATGPKNLQGETLTPFLNPAKKGSRKGYVLSQFHSNLGNTGSFMIRKDQWKYIRFGTNPPFQNYSAMLFDVEQDPEELKDLSAENHQIVQQLDGILNSILDPNAVDKEVKIQDHQKYMLWQADHASTYWNSWTTAYKGFDSNDKAHAQNWIQNGPFV